MVHGILNAGTVVAIVFVSRILELCNSSRTIDDFMRLQRQSKDSEICCKVSVIDTMLEKFPPIEVRHILKMAEKSETLEGYCMGYETHLAKLMEYVASCCFDRRHHYLVKQQVEGVEELYITTCLSKLIFDLLVRNSKCLTKVLESSTECLAEEASNSVSGLESKEMCPRLRSVIDCFTVQASDYCSADAASLLNKLFKRVVKATIRVDCGLCFHVRPDNESSTIDRARLTATIIVLAMVVFSLVILRWSYARKTCL